MFILGLTGSIGMGKSTVSQHLRERGVPICDADALVHELYEGEAVAPIEATFPGATTGGKGDRQELSARLLADPSGFKWLEAIVHPLVHHAEQDCLRAAHDCGATLAVLEIPLLIESGKHRRCDATLVVSAPPEIQRQRVLARPGMTPAKLDAILARQMPDADKRAAADFVVDTGATIEQTLAAVDAILAKVAATPGAAWDRYWS